jgi:asparagine synthase (glutamine-hydrolysing)
MCGILGTVNKLFDNSTLDLIKHRGPNDCGIEKFSANDHTVQFGHRRLSIIDLSSAGHQPMNSACNRFSIVFNGEIYNHLELRKKLPSHIIFNGHSDTETILHYLKEFGITGIKDFNGIFAIAYLDQFNKMLYLARDPFGVKPLYYHEGKDNTFTFSSEMNPIKHLIAQSHIDTEALATLLRLRFNPSPDTIIKEIKKIRPGHYLEIDLNTKDIVAKHCAFLDKIPKTIKYGTRNLIELYGEKVIEAVKHQLLSDVEVGILLSGGVDSALVACIAKQNYSGRLKAFTIGFEDDFASDEIETARETADLLGLEHYVRKITFTDFLNTIKVSSRIVEEPLASTSIIPMYFLSELAAKHVKVVLTGQGADEPLGGYTRYKSELVRNKIPGFLRHRMLPLAKLTSANNEKLLRGINAIGIDDTIERFLTVYEVFTEPEIEKLISVKERQSIKRIEYFYNLLDCENKYDSVERMMGLDSRLNLADDLLNYTDKITMHFSLECRVPMLDLKLVEFIESLPYHSKVSLFNAKIIHKQFAREILPGRIVNRKKKGFESPTKIWFKKESHIIEEILLSGGTTFSNLFNQRYISEIISHHKNGYNKEKQIFLLLSIYFIFDSFNIEHNPLASNICTATSPLAR